MSAATFNQIQKCFAIDFDKSAVNLEFREFAVDSDVHVATANCNAVSILLDGGSPDEISHGGAEV